MTITLVMDGLDTDCHYAKQLCVYVVAIHAALNHQILQSKKLIMTRDSCLGDIDQGEVILKDMLCIP